MGKVKHHYLVLHICHGGKLEGSFLEGKGQLKKYLQGFLEIEPVLIDEEWMFKEVAKVIQAAKKAKITVNPFNTKMLVIEYDDDEYNKL